MHLGRCIDVISLCAPHKLITNVIAAHAGKFSKNNTEYYSHRKTNVKRLSSDKKRV